MRDFWKGLLVVTINVVYAVEYVFVMLGTWLFGLVTFTAVPIALFFFVCWLFGLSRSGALEFNVVGVLLMISTLICFVGWFGVSRSLYSSIDDLFREQKSNGIRSFTLWLLMNAVAWVIRSYYQLLHMTRELFLHIQCIGRSR